MEAVLLEFLQRLEAVADQFDEQVCTALGGDVFHGFLKPDPNYQLPDAFGMRTEEADALVGDALARFLSAAHQVAQQFGLDTYQKRLDAVQNPNVHTAGGRNYEAFFDCLDAEWWDNEIRNRKAE
jgi:hypothetical protein